MTTLNRVPDFTVPNLDLADTSIALGDRVRSYDSQFQDDSFVEGTVIARGELLEGCERYRIHVERRVANGVEQPNDRLPGEVLPPINGTPHALGGFTNGVHKL